MKVGFLTVGDPEDTRTWSGTPHYMARALERHVGEVVYLGPLETSYLTISKACGRLVKACSGRRFAPHHAHFVARRYARLASARIAEAAPDVVFAPAASAILAFLESDVPVIYSSDATFKLVDGYHPHYRNLAAVSRRNGELLERAAIERATAILYPSEWAARSARQSYGAAAAKIHVVNYGANFDDPPDRAAAARPRSPGPFRILFVGGHWEDKGAGIAVDALRELRRLEVDAELTICGCSPPVSQDVGGLTVIPFLNKNDPEQRRRLHELYAAADLFCLPTRSDCYGIVFCEASAYGVPSIATATGGVPSVVREGENGHLLPPSADGAAYARLMLELLADADRLERLRRSSREAFERRLNWDSWGIAAREIAEGLAKAGNAGSVRTVRDIPVAPVRS